MNKNIELCQRVFSPSRMQPYLDKNNGSSKAAIELYRCNIMLSESFYPILSVLEVALRNAVSRCLEELFEKEEWYEDMLKDNRFSGLHNDINTALSRIQERKGRSYNSEDVIASFTLGFWTTLFNSEYERVLWRKLRLAFPYLEKSKRVRKTISSYLNRFRKHRNRVFHYEPIHNPLRKNKDLHSKMLEFLSWLDKDLPDWIEEVDGFEETYDTVVKNMSMVSSLSSLD